MLALTVTSFPIFISPNFEYMFDYNYKKKVLRIKDIRTSEIVLDIDPDILTMAEGDNEQ